MIYCSLPLVIVVSVSHSFQRISLCRIVIARINTRCYTHGGIVIVC